MYNPGAGHFEAVRDSRNKEYIFPYSLVRAWDKQQNTKVMTENQAKCQFTYTNTHIRMKGDHTKKFKVLLSEDTADQKDCKHVYIVSEADYGKSTDITQKIKEISFLMGYYEDKKPRHKELAFQQRSQGIQALFPGKKLEDLSFADIPELINITDTQDLYEYDPTKYEEQPADYKKSVIEKLNVSHNKQLAAEAPAAAASARTGVQWANANGGPLFTNKPNPGAYAPPKGSSGGGKPTPQQKLQAIFDIESNSDTKTYCDTVLTLLLIDMKRKMYDFDANKFMKKLGTSLGNTKPCPVVFHILKVILDEGMKQVIDSNAYIFSPQKSLNYTEDTFQNLEQRYAETFDDSEKEAFENMTPIRYYHRTPEEFRDLLGDSPYILSGHSEDAEPELRGVDVDGLYDEPLRMTADEKNLLTCGGIPLGAIIFMYITAVAKNKRSDLLKSLQSDPLLE